MSADLSTEKWADWCASDGNLSMSGTRMREHTRTSEGVKWCFHCRTRAEFEYVLDVPDGLSYYGPNPRIECTRCKAVNGDLFPGWVRTWEES